MKVGVKIGVEDLWSKARVMFDNSVLFPTWPFPPFLLAAFFSLGLASIFYVFPRLVLGGSVMSRYVGAGHLIECILKYNRTQRHCQLLYHVKWDSYPISNNFVRLGSSQCFRR